MREEVPPADQTAATGAGCPFTSIANAAFEQQSPAHGAIWTEEAARRLNNIPSFVRSWAQKGIEEYARERGYQKITAEVMDEVRDRFGM
ncbi:MAG: PCP reductase family protein [candidate division NC10 bacterium]|nr:PCP reductase family protein [candidate division NC10 bacterium]